jgi:electron transfer flavoprotein beta subunit
MNAPRQLQRIAVLVSVGRHPVSGTARYSRNDAAALELGRQLAERHRAQLDVVHAGDPANQALAEYLALGARGRGARVPRRRRRRARAAARVEGYDLVLTGTRAEGAYDTGMLPYRVAATLGYPLVGAAVDVTVDAGRAAVRQFLPKGLRRRVDTALPAVVAVHPLANAQPRYAYARLRAGAIRPALASSGADAEAAAWKVGPIERKPVNWSPRSASGHARMLSATTTESRGGNVVNEGSSVEKAQ